MSTTTSETLNKKQRRVLIRSRDLTIKFQGRDIKQFGIRPISTSGEYEYLDWDTKIESEYGGGKPFYSSYNYVSVLIDQSVPQAPRYRVVRALKEESNDRPLLAVREQWFPMNAVTLEIVEEEE